MLRQIIAISLLFTFLFSNMELHQLLKLPTLIEHYLEHKQENKNETLLNYLAEHYTKNITHQHADNHNDHQKLPFKTNDCAVAHIVIGFLPTEKFEFVIPNASFIEKASHYNEDDYLSNFCGNIWQPPKAC